MPPPSSSPSPLWPSPWLGFPLELGDTLVTSVAALYAVAIDGAFLEPGVDATGTRSIPKSPWLPSPSQSRGLSTSGSHNAGSSPWRVAWFVRLAGKLIPQRLTFAED